MKNNLGLKINLMGELRLGYRRVKDFYINDESMLIEVGSITAGEHLEKKIIFPVLEHENVDLDFNVECILKEMDIPEEVIEDLIKEMRKDRNYIFVKNSLIELTKSDIMKYYPKTLIKALRAMNVGKESSGEVFFEGDTVNIRSSYRTYSYTFPEDTVVIIDNRDNTREYIICNNLTQVTEFFKDDEEDEDYGNIRSKFPSFFDGLFTYGRIRREEKQVYDFSLNISNIVEAIRNIKYSHKNLISPFVIKNNYVYINEGMHEIPLQTFARIYDHLPSDKKDYVFGKYKIFDIDYPFEREELPLPTNTSFLIREVTNQFDIINEKELEVHTLTFDIEWEGEKKPVPLLKLVFECYYRKYPYKGGRRLTFVLDGYIKDNKINYVTYDGVFYQVRFKEGLKEYLDKLLFNLFDIEVGHRSIRDYLCYRTDKGGLPYKDDMNGKIF